MSIETTTVNYMDGDTVLECYIAYDPALEGRRPAVIVNHAWGGRDGFVENKARQLAEMGFVGFALDIYGKGILGTGPEENAALMQPFMEDREMLQNRILAALKTVKMLPWVDDTKIAAIGFCFGGLCVLDLARTGIDIKGVVSFHGLLGAPGNTEGNKISAKVLILHGNDDPMVPVEQVIAIQHELTEAGADWQVHSYGNTMHAFTNPVANDPDFGTVYQPDADRRSWVSMIKFLEEVFAG